jgi:organic hydroperoxide reductase OsmC/OhrA
MTETRHVMRCRTMWEARDGVKTTDLAGYSREHLVTAEGKSALTMSSAPGFQGDPSRHNPEDLYVMALSSCQMLTYLAVAGRAGIEVLSYTDDAEGVLDLAPSPDGRRRMRMTQVTLRPRIRVPAGTDVDKALSLVEKAHAGCFIASSVNCEVITQPEVIPG